MNGWVCSRNTGWFWRPYSSGNRVYASDVAGLKLGLGPMRSTGLVFFMDPSLVRSKGKICVVPMFD